MLHRYQSSQISPQKHIHELLETIRHNSQEARDPAWICVATEINISKQLKNLELLAKEKMIANLPLYGIPFAIKDNIDALGWETTAACPDFAFDPNKNATVVQKLIDAGAILIGKTNLDQFATGLVGTRSPYGAVPNTFDPTYVSGGSSSGSASVVARGLVCFSLGTDTAGSGRIPAAFNNIVGTKPTPGLVSTEGVFPACKSIDCVSIMTLTAADADIVLDVIKSTELDRDKEAQFHPIPKLISNFRRPPRIGIPLGCQFLDDGQYQKAFAKAIKNAKGLDVELVQVDIEPFVRAGKLLYDGPWVSERFAVTEDFLISNPDSFDSSVKQIIQSGSSYTAAQGFRAIYQLKELEIETKKTWAKCDVILVPSAPNHPTLEDLKSHPILKNSELGMYTNYVNLMRLCAVAVPAGFTDKGMPFGVTLIAQEGSDIALLKLAAQWQILYGLSLGKSDVKATHTELSIRGNYKDSIEIAVVGAHLQGMPLHSQLTERHAHLIKSCKSARSYRLFALPNTTPPKPGLVKSKSNGVAIDIEVYAMPASEVGSFLRLIPAPLGLGSIELDDGTWVKGFICEPYAIEGANDISDLGGWRAYMHQLGDQK
nr:allophanate hydrolase [Polynucleobacter sp. es-MAR-4]